jgi:hypothetical protein
MPRINKIILRNGTTAPNSVDFDMGEPAWDRTNGKLYIKNAAGSMVEIAGGSASATVDPVIAGMIF